MVSKTSIITHLNATFLWLATNQMTSIPRTMKMDFSGQWGGSPATPVDRAKLFVVAWQFTVDATTGSAPNSCIADLTIDDVRFY